MIETKNRTYIAAEIQRGHGINQRTGWLPLPASRDQFLEVQDNLGVQFGDFTIGRYYIRVPGLHRALLEEAPLGKINYLAARLQTLDREAVATLTAVMESVQHFTSVDECIEFTYQPDNFLLLEGVRDAAALGNWIMSDRNIGFLDVAGCFRSCVDLYMLGCNAAREAGGAFAWTGFIGQKDAWNPAPGGRKTPPELDLRGNLGEELYVGEWGRMK